MGRAAKDSIMKAVAALLVFVLHQVSSNWSGSGEFSCYGHLSTDVSTPEGGDYLGEGKVKPNSGPEFEIWAWDYHDWDDEHWPMPYATCEGQIWYKKDDMGAGYCTPHQKAFNGCGYASCVGDIVCTGC